jgi:mannitol-1-/sugar-/sorbitol-6-phosphatase
LQASPSVMNRFECRAVLFDLDGVLVDSRAFIEQQWRRWAESKGLRAEPFLQVCHGRRALETIRLAAPHLDATAELAAFRPEDFTIQTPLPPIPGAADLLRLLPRASWAVATSGPRVVATTRLEQAGLPIPEVLICAEDVGRGKPHPDVYLMAADRMAALPAECVVIEDAPAGILAARAAGMRVIALTTTQRRGELDADAWAGSLTEINVRCKERGAAGAPLVQLLVPQDAGGLDLSREERVT